jgi:hypothetical protein
VHLAVRAGAGEIGPAHGRNLKLSLLPTVVARGGAVDGAVGDFVGGKAAGCRKRKGRFQQDVLLMPVDVVFDVDLIAVEPDGLHEF